MHKTQAESTGVFSEITGARRRRLWRADYLRLRHDLKAAWMHGIPYIRGRMASERLPSPFRDAALKSLPVEAEAHILTSYRDWKMALWAIHSLIKFANGGIEIAIHDDGTLPECARRQFCSHFPSARIISIAEADSRVSTVLKGHKRMLHLRKRLKHFHKLTDFALFCTQKRMIVMDSDVLFFREPRELLAGPTGPVPHLFARDLWSTYDTPCNANILPPLADRICCGLGNVHRDSLDFDRMESYLALAGLDLDRCDIWIEQTLWALECAASGFEYLSGDYAITLGPGIGGLVSKHYIGGPSRDYFFIEGIDAVKQSGSPIASSKLELWREGV